MAQEQLRMQMLAGIITEGQYKAKLNEITVGEFPQYLANKFNEIKNLEDNQLAIALDVTDDDLSSEFEVKNVDGKQFITGNNFLISDDEYKIRSQAYEMDKEYDSFKLNIPEVGETELYYVFDPNA